MKKHIAIVFLFLTVVFLFSTGVAEKSKIENNVFLELKTNKQSYTANDNTINISVMLENNNRFPIKNVKIEFLYPNFLSLVHGYQNAVVEPNIGAGSILKYETKLHQSILPATGDNTPLLLLLFLLSLSGLFIFAFARKKYKHLSVFLCFAILVSSVCPLQALAAQSVVYNDHKVELDTSVMIDNQQVTIRAKVSWSMPAPKADEIIDLGYLQNLADAGLIDIWFGQNGRVSMIDGTFTTKKVTNITEALALLNDSAAVFGESFDASNGNMQKKEYIDGITKEYFYRFSPRIGNIPVLGSQIIIVTEADGTVSGLHSTYDSRIYTVNRSPSISQETAVETAKSAFMEMDSVKEHISSMMQKQGMTETEAINALQNTIKISSELAIYAEDDDLPICLVYQVQIDFDALQYAMLDSTLDIYATGENAGSVLVSYAKNPTAWMNTTYTYEGYTLAVQEDGGLYRLNDENRKIRTFNATNNVEISSSIYNSILDSGKWQPYVYVYNTKGIDDDCFLIHYNMEQTYDYYLRTLAREGYANNSNKKIDSIAYCSDMENNEAKYENACWTAKDTFFFGDGYADALDVVSHEFQHAVTQYVVGIIPYYSEQGAVNEAFSDIFGMLVEGKSKSNKGRWLIGEDSQRGASRSCKDPTTFTYYIDHYDKRYDVYKLHLVNDDNAGVHTNSTVMTHAVYLMMTDQRLNSITDEQWARIFYNALYRCETDVSMYDFSLCVYQAVRKYGGTDKQLQAVKEAFDTVGITSPRTIRFVLKWGDTPQDLDAHLIGPNMDGSDYHINYSNKYAYYTSYSNDDLPIDAYEDEYSAYLDYDDTTAYGPEIITVYLGIPGIYRYYVHDFTNKNDPSADALSQSAATVDLYIDGSLVKTYHVPNNHQGIYWNVVNFSISSRSSDEIKIVDINTVTSEN